MNCNKCEFYCYEDEYICPHCGGLQSREFPIDKHEKDLFIHEKIIVFNKEKRKVKLLKLGRRLFLPIFIIQIIWSIWIHSFVVVRIPKPNDDIASYSIVFALALYGIILGKPEINSDRAYVEIRQPKGLISKLKDRKVLYLSTVFLILSINFFIYSKYLKDLFITDIISRQNLKLESFGRDKLENIFAIRFYIQNIGIGIYYTIHSIFEITSADYFRLSRLDKYKEER